MQEKVLYTSYFRTSQHSTFAQKFASLSLVNDWMWAVDGLAGVQEIGRTVAGDEVFDAFEMEGVKKAGGHAGRMRPLVQFRAGLGTRWHATINKLVYHNTTPQQPGLTIGWTGRPTHIGIPPTRALLLDQPAEDVRLTDNMISSGLATAPRGKVAYVYQLPYYMFYDYYYLQQQAANSELDTDGVRYLLNTPFIPIYSGQYPVSIGYCLPGESNLKSVQTFTITKP